MKTLIRNLIILSCLLFFGLNSASATTYYWSGNSNNNWNVANNWTTTLAGGTASTSYPGQLAAGDIAVLGSTPNRYTAGFFGGTTNTINLKNALPYSLGQIIEPDNHYTNLNLVSNTAFTLTVTGGMTFGDVSQVAGQPSFLYLSSTGNAYCNLSVSGVTVISKNSKLVNNSVNITFNGPATSTTMAMTGASTTTYALLVNYYNITTVCAFTLNGYSQIQNYGTFVANATTSFQISGGNSSIYNDDYDPTTFGYYTGIFTANNTAIVLTGNAAFVDNLGGAFNLNTGSTLTLGGTSNQFINDAQDDDVVFNVNGSTVNLTGPTNLLYNDSENGFSAINMTNSSVLSLGTSAANGSSSLLTNTEEGYFYLGPGCYINMYGGGSKINNTSISGSYADFVCAPTSAINPFNTSSVVANANAANYFQLLSDNTGAATIGSLGSGATVTGQYEVQRYLTGGANTPYRNYRLLSSPVNKTKYTASINTSPNLIDIGALGANFTSTADYTVPATTYNGAYIAGPVTNTNGFTKTIPNPMIYLYQESIIPGTANNTSFTSGKNVGIKAYNSNTATNSYTVTTVSTATGGQTPADNSSNVVIPAGNGYILYYIGPNTRANTLATTPPAASVITTTGYINQGNVILYPWQISSSSLSAALTVTAAGTTAKAPVAGITMVGNPYPSTIDLHAVWAGNQALLGTSASSFYQLDIVTHAFDAYNSTTGSSGPASYQYVASGQGFYITAVTAGQFLTFTEAQKTASSAGAYIPSPSQLDITPASGKSVNSLSSLSSVKQTDGVVAYTDAATLTNNIVSHTAVSGSANPASRSRTNLTGHKLKPSGTRFHFPVDNSVPVVTAPINPVNTVQSPDKFTSLHLQLYKDSINYDMIKVAFNAGWNDNLDVNDAEDLDGLAPTVYLSSYTTDNVRASINAMGSYTTKTRRIKLYVKATSDGIYQLNLMDIQNFNKAHYNVFIVDKFLHDSLDMVRYKTFNVNLVAADTASYSNRFELVIEHAPVPQYALLSFSGQKVTSGVQLNWKTKNESNYTGFVLQKLVNNKYTAIDSLLSDSLSSYNFVDQHPALGNNIYRLQQTDVFGAITYTAPVTIGYNSTTSTTGDLTVYPNPAKGIINVTLNSSTATVPDYNVNIYNASGTVIGHRTINTTTWTEDVSSYKLGVYIIEIKNNNGILVGKSKFVKVN